MGMRISCWFIPLWAFGIVLWTSGSLYAEEPGLTGVNRDNFIRGAVQSCGEKQYDAPQNAAIPKPLLVQFCTCYATGMADRTSTERLRTMSGLSTAQRLAEMKLLIDAANAPCIKELKNALQKK